MGGAACSVTIPTGITAKSTRLHGYDYARHGAYVVTTCTHARECLFGEVIGDAVVLNAAGALVEREWQALPARFASVALDALVVMPNHVHGILRLGRELDTIADGQNRDTGIVPAAATSGPTLGQIMRAFKSLTAIGVNALLGRSARPLWQRGYYDQLIRDPSALARARRYIVDNPARWGEDPDHASNVAVR